MPSPPRRGLTSDRRRALRLLAGALDEGCTEVIMLAHGFSIDLMVELINAGLATARPSGWLRAANRYQGHPGADH